MQIKSVNGGFTLIEMVIAIAILGLLAAVAYGPVKTYMAHAKEKTTIANMQSIKQAIEAYHTDTGYYPQTLKDLIRRPLDEEAAEGWRGKDAYLDLRGRKDIPKDGWDMKFVYRLNEEDAEKPYEFHSYGPTGKRAPKSEWLFA